MQTKAYTKVNIKTKLMMIRLASIRPKIGTVSDIGVLLGINYENAKTIVRRYRIGSQNLNKLLAAYRADQKKNKSTK